MAAAGNLRDHRKRAAGPLGTSADEIALFGVARRSFDCVAFFSDVMFARQTVAKGRGSCRTGVKQPLPKAFFPSIPWMQSSV